MFWKLLCGRPAGGSITTKSRAVRPALMTGKTLNYTSTSHDLHQSSKCDFIKQTAPKHMSVSVIVNNQHVIAAHRK